ncbi:TPA: type III secretion system gatekeeper subunit SctW [Salmonella enterica subsp. enterica serovar 6,7:y:-]
MENNISPGSRLSFFRKYTSRIVQQDVCKQKGAEYTGNLQTEDLSPGAEIQRYVQSTDEMSAAITQFRNRRDYDKKNENLSNSFERVLDEDVLPKVKQILQLVRNQNISIEKLLYYIREFFSDDSDLVLVLRELLNNHDPDSIEGKNISAVLQRVEEKFEPRLLNAGINCALKARLFSKALSLRPGLLRATYRQFIVSTDSEVEIYAEWISCYGCKHRNVILNYIEEALLADMSSQVSSSSCSEFGYLLKRLWQIKILRSADKIFILNLNESLSEYYTSNNDELWLLLMLALLQNPGEVEFILTDTIGKKMLMLDYKARNIFLQAIYVACKSIPASLLAEEQNSVLLEHLKKYMNRVYLCELAGCNVHSDNLGC